MNVFFYGLFMDETVLARKGIVPKSTAIGYVDGFALRIGERATLVPAGGARAYGVMMEITPVEASALYADESVSDYQPEAVSVIQKDGSNAEAVCYNLPADKVIGANKEYARALLSLASQLGFPVSYIDILRRAEK